MSSKTNMNNLTVVLVIFCMIQCQIGACYNPKVEITLAAIDETTTTKSLLFSRKNILLSGEFGTSSTTDQSKDDFSPLPPTRQPIGGTAEDVPEPKLPHAWTTESIPSSSVYPSSPTPPSRSKSGPSSKSTSTRRKENSIASDDEIRTLTEKFFTNEVNDQLCLIRVNVQGQTRTNETTDEAPQPLLVVDEKAFESPTIAKLRLLFNNYEINTMVHEDVTPNERKEENDFLDAVMATAVMAQAMQFLQDKGLVSPEPKTQRDLVKELWFTQYSRGKGKIGSSGFEHVFVNEVKNGKIIGLHNWVYFYEEEKAGRVDYKGYMQLLDLGAKAKVLRFRHTYNGLNKRMNTLFLGTSPELELALYTVCFKVRPNRYCPISLDDNRFGILTFSWHDKNWIASAFPTLL